MNQMNFNKKRTYIWPLLLRKHTKEEGAALALTGACIIWILGLPKITAKSLWIVAGVCFGLFLLASSLSVFLQKICFPDLPDSKEDTGKFLCQFKEELFPYEERYERDAKFFIASAIAAGMIGLAISSTYSWIAIPAVFGIVIKGIHGIIVKMNSTFPEPTTKNVIDIIISSLILGLVHIYKNDLSETEPVSFLIQGVCFLTAALVALYYIKKIIDEYKKEKRFNNTCEDLLYHSLLHIGLIVWNILFHCILKL